MKVKPLKVIKYLIPILFLALLGIFLAKWSDVKKVDLVSNKSIGRSDSYIRLQS